MKRLVILLALATVFMGGIWLVRPGREHSTLKSRPSIDPNPAIRNPPSALAPAPVPTFRPESRASTPQPDTRPSAFSPQPSALPAAILLALSSGLASDRDRVINDLLPLLVAQDQATATRLVEGLSPGPLREELLRQLARLMSASNIADTMAWLASLPEPDQPLAAEAVVAQIRQSDPAGALEVAEVFRIGLNDGRLEHVAQLWTEEKPADAIAWVKNRPAGPLRDRLVARIAFVRARSDPAEATALVQTLIALGATRDDALAAVERQHQLNVTSR